MEVRLNDLYEIFHTGLDVNALAVNEERRCFVKLQFVGSCDILENTLLQGRGAERLHEPIQIQSDFARQGDYDRLRVVAFSPLALMLEESVMHFPVVILFTGCFGRQSAEHGIRMDADEREVMKLQPQLIGIAAQDLLDERMIGTATWTFIIPKLNQCHLRVFGSPEMATTFDVHARSGGVFRRMIGVAAEKDGGTGRYRDGNNDDDGGFKEFSHLVILALQARRWSE